MADEKPNRGAQLFAAYLKEQKMSQSKAGQFFGVAKSYIGILANMRATPGLGVAARIEALTEGEIPASSWKVPPVIP
jgi:transcriptional regulator with XRE-family HTH domain